MKKKIIIIAILIVLILISCLAIFWHRNNSNNNDFYLKYEYQDHWGGEIKQVVEINNLEYNFSLLINNHYELENIDEKNDGTLTEEQQNNITKLIKANSNNWKKQNNKIKKFVDNATDMPYEHLIIKNNGVTFELDYLPLSVKSVFESALDKNIFSDIEREYNNSKSSQLEQEQKLMLELPHHIDIQEENEKTLNRKNETINIKNLNLESIEKGKLKDYVNKLQPIIDFIKNKYPNFDINKWNIMCNMYSEHGDGILKLNYVINDIIETNKSISFTIKENTVILVNFVNLNLNADENKVFEEIKRFESIYEQQKKKFASNEEFISEETYYTYFYNLDKLIYTYQLYFYETIDNEKLINNSYVSEYVVNEKSVLVEI